MVDGVAGEFNENDEGHGLDLDVKGDEVFLSIETSCDNAGGFRLVTGNVGVGATKSFADSWIGASIDGRVMDSTSL